MTFIKWFRKSVQTEDDDIIFNDIAHSLTEIQEKYDIHILAMSTDIFGGIRFRIVKPQIKSKAT